MKLRDYTPRDLKKIFRRGVYQHPYIEGPHTVFAHVQKTGDRKLLLRYAQEQPPVSHQFLIALGELGTNLIGEGRRGNVIIPDITETAFYVVSNLAEELKDPQANISHVNLLGDYQRAVENDRQKRKEINFTRSQATATYEHAMTQGMTDTRTGLLYLAVMETWMRPEYDMLEIASTKAGIPRERQVYFDANRDADMNHVDISIEGAIKLAQLDEKWNVDSKELERISQQSCNDRSAFWDQFKDLI